MTKNTETKAELILARGAVEQAVLDYEQAVRLYGKGGAAAYENGNPVGFPAIEAERNLRNAMARYASLGGVLA